MKRTLALILALVMIVGMIPMSVFADETTPTLTFTHDVTDVSALKAGDTFTVTATLTNNPGFAAFQFDLDWDNTVVQFDGFSTEEFRGVEFLVSDVIVSSEYDQTTGVIVVGESENITTSGKLFEANFTVIKEGDAGITFKKEWPSYELKQADQSEVTATFDESALAELTITHTHNFNHSVEVTAPTCTAGGYTTYTCTCGDSYTGDTTPATGHTNVNGTCSVCGAALTVIPEGAPFLEIVTADGKNVTVTDMGMEPNYQMGTLYKVEVPLGTTQVNITYNQGDVLVDQFGYASVIVVNDPNVSQDGYGQTTKEGKTIVGLQMEKAAANGFGTLKLLNIPYPSDPYELRAVGLMKDYYEDMHFFAFTYALEEGQHFAVLPEGVGYTVSGNAIASNGYKFNVAIDEGFEDTEDFAVKVNGETIATQPGEVTVSSVTEDLYITVEGVAKIADPDNDIILTVDLTGYTGEIEGSIWYSDNEYNNVEIPLTAGKKNTLALTASKSQGFFANIYSISPLVVGYDVNGTEYAIPNSYTGHDLGNGYKVNLNNDGYMQLGTNGTNPGTFVIKPVLGTSESVGAAPAFVENCIKVTDISVVGADVIRSAWEGDTLNVILAEDTALDAPLKTMWTIYANNTKEGASQPCFNINGRLQTPSGTEATFTWVESMTLEDGTATKTAAFAVADMPWNPESALEFTPKTFTINFYVSGKEPAPEPEQPVSNPITNIEISHPNIKTETNPETGATSMTMAMVTGASETIDLSFTVQNADQEATQEIAWSSSDPEVATVENGKVTALKAGETTITAKAVDPSGVAAAAEGEEVLAQFTLTVSDPAAGYTVTMGQDVENTVIGSTVSIPVAIGHTDETVTQFSAYDMTFTYDPAVLKLATFGTEITDVKDDNGNSTGTIHVEHYGDKTDNGTALTLTFEAIATGETNVKVTAAKVDISESALTQDAPDASIRDNITLVSVTGYTINLPADFEGKTSILPGETYTFEAKDKNYTYDFSGSTMGGQSVTITEIKDENGNGTGKYQIENVSGNIVISSEKTGKTFKVTLTGDGIAPAEGFTSGENAAQYNVDYKAQLAEIDKWNYSYTVTIGGKEYTDYTVKDGVIIISGEDITGEISITVTRTAVTQDKHQVTIEGATGDVAGHAPEVENNQDYTFTVNKVVGYTYTVTATMDGQPVAVIDNGDGTYTIKNVTGVLKINVQKEYIMTVEVVENYVKVEGKSMFLVLAETAVDTGKVLSYDGTPMFYTTKYSQQTDGADAAGKWAYLVFTETTLSEDEAKAEITLADVSESVIKVTLDQTFNVNESGITDGDSIGTVDINDAQLVYDMYNAVYENFENGATMQKFLKADVNSDRKVDVNDAMAIVDEIIKAK